MKKLLAILVRAIIIIAEKGYSREGEKYCIYNNNSSRGYSNSITYFNCNCNCN
jgi:hypothetical protein